MTPEIAELRAKADYHQDMLRHYTRQIALIEGYSRRGPEPTCLVNLNGRDIWFCDRHFVLLEILRRDEDAGVWTSRRELAEAINCTNRILSVILCRINKRIAVAGVKIERSGIKKVRLNTINAAAP